MKTQTKQKRFLNIFKWSAIPTAMIASGIAITMASNSAFTASTTNQDNSWSFGSAKLTNNMTKVPLFTENSLAPGDKGSRCIVVESDGTVDGNVRLYLANSSETNLGYGSGVRFTITKGSGAKPGCEDFKEYATEAVIFNNRPLSELRGASSYQRGLGNWVVEQSEESPKKPVTMTYKFDYDIEESLSNAAQGGRFGMSFIWELQSVPEPT